MSDSKSQKDQLLMILVVLSLSLGCAAWEWSRYLADSTTLWSGFYHDRHVHCENAMGIAIALRTGNVVQFFDLLERAKVWPPTHMLLGGAIMAFTGPDHRWAVLPSLIGWVMTMTASAWIVWRLSGGGVRGFLGAAATWVLVASSPTSKAFAVDCMLESLGAGLTTLSIALYLRACDDRSNLRRWQILAFAMTLLFFEKYQYWMITFAGLLVAEFVYFLKKERSERQSIFQSVSKFLKAQLPRECRHPVTIVGLVAWGIIVGETLLGKPSVTWGERTIPLPPPTVLLMIAYVCFIIRMISLTVQQGWHRPAVSGPAIATQMTWHLAPIACSLLIPGRLSRLIWTVGPTNVGEKPGSGIFDALAIYLHAELFEQHTTVLVASMVGLLALAGFVQVLKEKKNATMVLAIAMLGIALTLMHPNQKPRYVINWQPAIWMLAGLGLAGVASSSMSQGLGRIRSVAAMGGIAVIAWAAMTTDLTDRNICDHTPNGTLIPLAQRYLDSIDDGQSIALLTTEPDRSLFRWTFGDRKGSFDFEFPGWQAWDCVEPERYSQSFHTWIQQTPSDVVVVFDVPPSSPLFCDLMGRYAVSKSLTSLMESQQKYSLSERWNVSGATVSTWRLPKTAERTDRVERR